MKPAAARRQRAVGHTGFPHDAVPDGADRMRRRHLSPAAIRRGEGVDRGPDPDRDDFVKLGWQPPRRRPRIRLPAAADELYLQRLPEPGDCTGPPAGRLIGGTGDPIVAEASGRWLRHLVHHVRGPAARGLGG